jgi:ABC-2 type transport system ATP-binding protein
MKIEMKDYCKTIRGAEVLKHVSATFTSGNIYGLKGENGCGKTMMMRAVSGLILPTSGCVEIDGKVLGKDISFPESIGVLIENPAFLNAYTGFKNLRFLADIQKKVTDDEIREAITAVGLDPNDKRSYRKYSLGMKERLGIASAIMGTPELMILDEPLNGVDESGVEMVKNLLTNLKKKNKLIIMSCHDSEDLYSLCNVVIHVKAGKITDTEGEAQ